jgi:chloramphenicol-sensitive protein RarD
MILAFAFGAYGLVKKLAGTGAVESLAVETGVTLLPALIYLGALQAAGTATFAAHGAGHALLMAGGGIVSTLPLLAFAGAATRIPLSMVGLLQYIAPVMQFAFGVLLYREHMPLERWIGFALVWLALVVLTWDGLRGRRPVDCEPTG